MLPPSQSRLPLKLPRPRDLPSVRLIVVAWLFATAGCTHPDAGIRTPPRPSRHSAPLPRNETLEWAAKDEETPPKVLRSENPVYPLELRSRGVRGTVVVEFTIGTDGKVTRAHAVHSPHPALSRLAVEAVQRWEYTPAKRHGRAVETTFQTRIDFRP